MDKAVTTYIAVLKAEIEHLKSQLQPHDTGHIHTTISTLKHRVCSSFFPPTEVYIHFKI